MPLNSSNAAIPGAPTINSVTAQNGYLEVAFTGASNVPTNYDYSVDGGLSWTTRNPSATWSPLTIYGLANGTTYSVRIRARNADGVGSASNAISATPANRSQITSNQGFLQGNYVEVGIRQNGAFGSSVLPTGLHGNSGQCLGFRVDRQKNGWGATSGSNPNWVNIDDGDYFCPGTQYEGWSLKVGNGTTAFNNHENSTSAAIPGSISNLVTTAEEQSIDWQSTSSYQGISVKQVSRVPTLGQSLHVDVTLTNTSANAISNIFYGRGYDPDNATGNNGSSTSSSINRVLSRGGVGQSAQVRSTFASGAEVILRSTDERGRASAGDTLSCCTPSQADPVTVWNSTSPWNLNVGTDTTGDKQVALAVKIESLAAGESATFRISYVLTADEALSPSVTTLPASNVDSSTSVTLNATVNPNGAPTTVEFEYGTDPNLTSGNTTEFVGTLTGSSSQAISSNISGLTSGETYYFRVKASNTSGSSSGVIQSFTPIGIPILRTLAASNIGETTVTLNGDIDPGGGSTNSITFLYSTNSDLSAGATVSALPALVSGIGTSAVAANLSGLTPGVTYHYRLLADNEAGSATGAILNFTTTPAPTVTTLSATSVTSTSATLNATVNANNVATNIITFTYGRDSQLISDSVTVTASPSSATGSSPTSVSIDLTGLSTGSTYYFRVYAQNANGSNTGTIQSFTVSAPPLVATVAATLEGGTVTLNGSVNANGASTSSILFVYGTSSNLTTETATITSSPSSVAGNSTLAVSRSITGLAGSTTYYFLLKASNAQGTTSGSILSFTTPTPDTTAPTVSLTTSPATTTISTPITVTITFSEAVTGFSSTDLTLGGTATGFAKGSAISLSSSRYQIILSPASATRGSLTLNVPLGAVTDLSGNLNIASSLVTLTIVGTPASISISLSTTSINRGSTVVITALVDADGRVTFIANGRNIKGCVNRNTSALQATCNWQPSRHGINTVSAVISPTSADYTSSRTTLNNVNVVKRASRS